MPVPPPPKIACPRCGEETMIDACGYTFYCNCCGKTFAILAVELAESGPVTSDVGQIMHAGAVPVRPCDQEAPDAAIEEPTHVHRGSKLPIG
jgi:transcription elongation factor Elf1